MNNHSNGIPILLWPFYAVWRLLTFVVELIGRLLCGMLGIGLMVAGVAITLSIIGAPVGIPLASVGFLLLVRSIF
jgi:small-conductance mechanosensitive channel